MPDNDGTGGRSARRIRKQTTSRGPSKSHAVKQWCLGLESQSNLTRPETCKIPIVGGREKPRGGGRMGRMKKGGEAPIKGDCPTQCPVIQADERIQGIGQSQELNQGCPMQWIRSVEQQVCLRPPWHLTAQIHLNPHGGKQYRSLWIPMASKAAAQIRQGSVG